MGLSYQVLRVEPSGIAEIDYIQKEDLFTKYKVYAPLIKKYKNISFAIPEYKTDYNNIVNIKMNTLFKDYKDFTGINYIILDLTQEPDILNAEYKKLIADVASL